MTTYKWYVTTQWYTWRYGRVPSHRTPRGPAHAKTFGAARTACGIPCGNWTKFWHLPCLQGMGLKTCLDCDLVLSRTLTPISAPID